MENYLQSSDTELVMLIKDGDTMAFRELYNRYWNQLYNTAYKRLKLCEVAEEVVQDLFADVWARRQNLTINTIPKAYLFGALRYLVIKQVQLEMTKSNYTSTAYLHTADTDNSTEETIMANDLYNWLQGEVANLPDRCREVFVLSRDKHKSNKEIAHTLGITEKTVENQITRALRYLKTTMRFLFF